MSTPQERAIALDLAIKALAPSDIDVWLVDTYRNIDAPAFKVVEKFEQYIAGPQPATVESPTKTEVHDVSVEHRNEDQLELEGINERVLNCARCGALHVTGAEYDHPWERSRETQVVTPSKTKRCKICNQDRDNFRHNDANRAAGGHAFK